MTTVSVRDLVVEYPGRDYVVRPIDGVSLEVPSGSLTILLGPSGCGKTTLLSCLAGILTPTAGEVIVGRTNVGGLDPAGLTQYRRNEVGVVFQAFNLVPSLSALENVAAPLLGAGWKRGAARARAAELLAQVDLTGRAKHRPGGLSGGQQQRVAIARALAHDPALVVADEPTAHLDYVQVEGILNLVRGLATEGRAVIVATHDDRMLPLADQVIHLAPDTVSLTAPETVELAAGAVLFDEGSRGGRVYVVNAGAIEILRRKPSGSEERLATKKPGEFFGEMGPIFRLPRTASARAKVDSVVTGYSLDDFREFVGAEHLRDLIGGGTVASGRGDAPEAAKRSAPRKATKATQVTKAATRR